MPRIVLTTIMLLALGGVAQAQPAGEALTASDVRALVEASQATAKASRDTADHARVMPDILHQILAKLDKIENKLDKLENLQRRNGARR